MALLPKPSRIVVVVFVLACASLAAPFVANIWFKTLISLSMAVFYGHLLVTKNTTRLNTLAAILPLITLAMAPAMPSIVESFEYPAVLDIYLVTTTWDNASNIATYFDSTTSPDAVYYTEQREKLYQYFQVISLDEISGQLAKNYSGLKNFNQLHTILDPLRDCKKCVQYSTLVQNGNKPINNAKVRIQTNLHLKRETFQKFPEGLVLEDNGGYGPDAMILKLNFFQQGDSKLIVFTPAVVDSVNITCESFEKIQCNIHTINSHLYEVPESGIVNFSTFSLGINVSELSHKFTHAVNGTVAGILHAVACWRLESYSDRESNWRPCRNPTGVVSSQ